MLAGAILAIIVALVWFKTRVPDVPILPVQEQVLLPALTQSNFQLRNLTLGGQGAVYGARRNSLFRIKNNGHDAQLLFTFEHAISAIHERSDGLLLVATDNDHWNPDEPCHVYRSLDGGKQFKRVKTIQAGSLLWWSIDSDQRGYIYLAEYGPQRVGMSKTLWRSMDDGQHWQAIYQAPDKEKTHLHRIAVDPYTNDLWLTQGDGKNRLMLHSIDRGESWRQIERLQATAVAFGPKAIYWGKDKKDQPGILRFDRKSERFGNYFEPDDYGNYGGSIYDMMRLPDGRLVIPFMKYPDQTHVASVWLGRDKAWQPILHLKSEKDKGAGMETIAGPDQDGWVYLPGYQFKVSDLSLPD